MEDRIIKSNISIEGAKVGFRNFAGVEGKFNRAGARNFCVFLEQDLAKDLESDGWNVKWLSPREEGDDFIPYLQVAVAFGKIPPKLIMMTSKGKTQLDESSVNILDWAEMGHVDLIIRPYNWTITNKDGNKTGVKAYVKAMYITLIEDEFESKYLDAPTSAQNAIGGGDDMDGR